MDAEESLGTPTHMEYSLVAFALILLIVGLLYLLFSPIIKGLLSII